MNFLLVNDDGIQAEGITSLAKALSQIGDVYVCAPHEQKSTTGHGITLFKALDVKVLSKSDFPWAVKAWECTGYPADCTKMGIYLMEKEGLKPDMIFSGINHGGNMGHDTLYSGTVAAAMEGSYFGIPSVAISVDSHEPKHFGMACRLAIDTATRALGNFPVDVVININTPDLPEDQIKGVKIVHIGDRKYTDHYEERDGHYYLEGDLLPYEGNDFDCDAARCEAGFAVITPIKSDLTNYECLKTIEEIYK